MDNSEVFGAEFLEFPVGDTTGFIVKPTRPAMSEWKPWIWYAPSLRGEGETWQLPTQRHAEFVRGLLAHGFYFCGVDVGESYGNLAGRKIFSEFYKLLVEQYRLSPKVCLFPVSRGGLMHFNWAIEHPESVQCIGAIYPVCNLKSYPGIEKASVAYGMDVEQLKDALSEHNPLDRLQPIASAGIPILLLHGDADEIVPLRENSAEIVRRIQTFGGKVELDVIEGKGHETGPEFWQSPRLRQFFLEHGLKLMQMAKEKG